MHTLVLGVIFGILAVHTGVYRYSIAYAALSLASIMLLRLFITQSDSHARLIWKQSAILFSGFAIAAALAVYYHDTYTVKQGRLLECIDVCVFQGFVVARPESVEHGYRYQMQLLELDNETLFQTYAVVEIPKTYQLTYGDVLTFRSSVHLFQTFQSDTGRIVPYDNIMESKNMHAQLKASDVQLGGHVSSLTRHSVRSTDMLIEALKAALPEPVAGLAQGVAFGIKGSLDEESETLFRITGLSHITVFSGSNVAILLAGVWFLTGTFPYMMRVLFSLSALLAVLVGVGISPPTLRASLMGAMYVVARAVGKSADGLSILSVSVLCMLLLQPNSLIYDLSFQLSVLAVVALMTIAVPIENKLSEHVPQTIAALIAMTLSVLIVVAPWVAYVFGTFSPSSFIANILVVPLVPIALVSALICASVAVALPVLTPIVAYPTEMLYSLVFTIAQMCAALPYSSIELSVFHGWYVCGWYAVLTLWYVSTLTQKSTVSLHHPRLDH